MNYHIDVFVIAVAVAVAATGTGTGGRWPVISPLSRPS